MLVLSVLLILVSGILMYLLFAPFYLEIDSTKELYRVRFHKIISARIVIEEGLLLLDVKMAWWTKRYKLNGSGSAKAVEKDRSENKKGNGKGKLPWKKMKAVLASFKINKCSVVIDTGDMQLNGILYPFFLLLSFYSGKNFGISFNGDNEVKLEIENNIARMSWAYISS